MVNRNAYSMDVETRSDTDVVSIHGVIDESSDLSPLADLGGRAPQRPIELNMRGVRRINSFGVRAWLDTIRKLPVTAKLSFVHCPPPVVDQCNMVAGFLGHGQLVSFYAPMLCIECDEQVDQLFQTDDCRANGGKLPKTPCPRCGRAMEVDDLEDQYLLFVREG
jgi:hypothetical protein